MQPSIENGTAGDDDAVDGGAGDGMRVAPQSEAEDAALLDAEAAVYLATEDRGQAIAALQRECALLGDVPAARAVQQRIDALIARNRLDAANAARRPVVHVALDQSKIVRARLDRVSEDDVTPTAQQEEQP
jgi:hypothetical protein